MMLLEARRVRHFYVRRDTPPTNQAPSLHDVLTAALERADVRAGWLDGVATLEAPTLGGRTLSGVLHARVSGPIEHERGAPRARLFATGAHADFGVSGLAGALDAALVRSLEAHVVAFDEGAPARATEPSEPTEPTVAVAPEPAPPRPAALPSPEQEAHLESPPSNPSEPARAPAPAPAPRPSEPRLVSEPEAHPPTKVVTLASAPLPAPPARKGLDLDAEYPEVGDHATHFLFGDCEVIDSDGERIKLKQKKDSRVREVSLSVLSLEPPTRDAQGVRHFALNRKK